MTNLFIRKPRRRGCGKVDGARMTSTILARMPTWQRNTPAVRTIEIVTFPHANVLDVSGPLQVFSSTNDWARDASKPLPYAVQVVARTSPVATNSGLALVASPLPGTASPVDTLIVSGGSGVHVACNDRYLVDWLKVRARQARRVVSVCTGAFLLGAAGLLAGRRAVTHWIECNMLANKYPSTRVEVDPIFIRDGRIWTSAGVTAGIDLCLALIEEDLGHRAAMDVARSLVVFLKRSGGQAQFSTALEFQQSDARFEKLHAWMTDHLSSNLSVAALAEHAGMSQRSFIRHYRAATGVSPARAVERIRLDAAQRMLAETGQPIKRIAQRCGFGSEETLRQSFRRLLGIAPSDFRERFAGARVESHT